MHPATYPTTTASRPLPAPSPATRALYAVAAVAMIALSFTTIFRDTRFDYGDGVTGHTTYGSLYDMADRSDGTPAILGLVLLYVFALLAFVAAWSAPRPPALYVTLTLLTAVGAILLIARPNTGDPTPGFATGGVVLLTTTVVLGLVALLDAVTRIVHAQPRG